MTRHTNTRSALMLAGVSTLALGLALTLGVGAGKAQTQPIPPEHYTLDPRGVDLVDGSFNYVATEVVIGQPGQGGLVHSRQFVGAASGWRDVEVGGIYVGAEMSVTTGLISEAFVYTGAAWVSKYDNGSTLQMISGGYVVTDAYGNEATFADINWSSTHNYAYNTALVASERSPDGTETTYHWKYACPGGSLPTPPCIDATGMMRLQSITNNRGYQLKFNYASDDRFTGAQWRKITSVIGINNAVDYCAPDADVCTGLTQTWPSVAYSGGTVWPTTATDQAGRVTTYGYTGALELDTIRYPGSGSADVDIDYDGSGRVSAVTDASGAWSYNYATVGSTHTTTASGPLSQSLVVVSDLTTGRASSVTDAGSNTWSYLYDADLRIERVTSPEGNYTEYDYDGRGNITQVTHVPKSGSGLSNIVVETTYPASCTTPYTLVNCNRPLSVEDARGNVTTYDWDATHGGLLSVTQPAVGGVSPQTRHAYSALYAWYKNSGGTIVQDSNPITLPTQVSTCATGVAPACLGTVNETRATTTYGAPSVANNLLPTSVAVGAGDGSLTTTTAMTYDHNGDLRTVDGPLAGAADTTEYRYDLARRVIGVVGPDPDGGGGLLNPAQRITYDSRGLVTLVEAGTTPGYTNTDWSNFVTLQRQAATYDSWRRPLTTAVQDSGGTTHQLVQVSYDVAGRVSCSTVRMNPATFGGLPGSACTAATTGGYGPDRIAQFAYNALGQVTSTTTGLGTSAAVTEAATYTANGRPASLTDGQGNVSILVYDGFDRLDRLRYPNATGGGTSTTDYEQYGYDAAGNVTSYRSRKGDTFASTYDALNRRTLFDGPSTALDVAYAYDNLGRMLTATGASQTTTNVYDALSRLTSQTTTPLGAVSYQYDLAGRRTRMTWPGSGYVNYDWNLSNALTEIKLSGTTSVVAYGYDDLGRRTSATRGNGVTTAWGYDGVSRLTSLSHDLSGSTYDVAFAYGYNPAGQIVTQVRNNDLYAHAFGSTATQTSVIDGLNRLATLDTVNLTYDANSNITSDTARTFTYDLLSRLTGTGSSSLEYDALGRLSRMVGTAGARYLYDGIEITGVATSGTTIGNHFVRGPGPDEMIIAYPGGSFAAPQWSLQDHQGSVIAVTDASGAATAVNTYDEYGVPGSSNSGRMQYTGQLWLPDFGLYHYKARAYHPGIGRFMQTDPIGYVAGMNLYGYVGGDPVNWIDPLGLDRLYPDAAACRRAGGRTTGEIHEPTGYEICSFDFITGGAWTRMFGGGDGFWDWSPWDIAIFNSFQGGDGPSLLNKSLCSTPSISAGVGIDAYAVIGASLSISFNADFVNGRFGVSIGTGVGVGAGVNAGFHLGTAPSGGGIVSANIGTTVGGAAPVAPGVNLGGSISTNYLGTDVGQYAAAVGRFGTPTAFANGSANASFMTPSARSSCGR